MRYISNALIDIYGSCRTGVYVILILYDTSDRNARSRCARVHIEFIRVLLGLFVENTPLFNYRTTGKKICGNLHFVRRSI